MTRYILVYATPRPDLVSWPPMKKVGRLAAPEPGSGPDENEIRPLYCKPEAKLAIGTSDEGFPMPSSRAKNSPIKGASRTLALLMRPSRLFRTLRAFSAALSSSLRRLTLSTDHRAFVGAVWLLSILKYFFFSSSAMVCQNSAPGL